MRARRLVLAGLAVALIGLPAAERVAAQEAECSDALVHCVGAGLEYADVQHAVDAAGPGHVVWVTPGSYAGFRVRRGGTPEQPLRIVAAAGVRITGTEPFSQEGIYLENVSWVWLEGFVVERAGMPGVGIGAHDARPETPMRGLVIRNNTVRDAEGPNLYLSQVADSVVEGNLTTGSRTSHGIYLANAGADRTVLRGNNSHGNAKNGIHFNGDLSSTGDGLQTGLLVDGNVLHGNRANGLNMDGVRDSVVRNNLVFGNGRHGLRAYAIDGAAGPQALTIVNNTFAANGAWAVKLTDDDGGHTIFNNILLSRRGSLAVANPEITSDHNVGPGPFSVDGERTVLSLRDWQALGFDLASRTAAGGALFLDDERQDYRLAPGSPAIGAGATMLGAVAAPEADLAGRVRDPGSPSAGAFGRASSGAQRGQ